MNPVLEIANFLGLKSVKIEVKQFLILIGPQASGKSVIAKLIHYFQTFPSELIESIENKETKYDFDKRLRLKFGEYFPPNTWNTSAFKIKFTNDTDEIEIAKVESRQANIEISYSRQYVSKLKIGKNYIKKQEIKIKEEEMTNTTKYKMQSEMRRHIYEIVKKDLSNDILYEQLFIPAGRSFFSNLQSSIFDFLSNNNAIDPFIRDFGSYYEMAKFRYDYDTKKGESNKKLYESIGKRVHEILKGKYHEEKGKDFLILDDGRKLNVLNCSSGQQEVLPLALILSDMPFLKFQGGGQTVYIEEPEAHLFPTAQKQIVELLGLIHNTAKSDIRFIITTHSPYILSSFNNLIQAGNSERCTDEEKRNEVYSIVKKDLIIDIKAISAYSLRDGKVRTLVSKDTDLINTNIIDEVSNEINSEFSQLIDMECK